MSSVDWEAMCPHCFVDPLTLPRNASALDHLKRYAFLKNCNEELAEGDCKPKQSLPEQPPPYEEAFEHYRQLFSATAALRGIRMHSYAGSSGPWLENFFMKQFMLAPYSFWYPLIPVFIPVTDLTLALEQVQKQQDMVLFKLFLNLLPEQQEHQGQGQDAGEAPLSGLRMPRLRKDLMYVLVIQYDSGPFVLVPHCAPFRNMLVFSSGGFGNIPLPLYKAGFRQEPGGTGNSTLASFTDGRKGGHSTSGRGSNGSSTMLTLRKTQQGVTSSSLPRRSILSFLGRATYTEAGVPVLYRVFREEVLERLKRKGWGSLPLLDRNAGLSLQDFVSHSQQSCFILAMRGAGSQSFRFYEALALGRVPIYVYKDLLWLPYGRSRRKLWGRGGIALVTDEEGIRTVADTLCGYLLAEEEYLWHLAQDGYSLVYNGTACTQNLQNVLAVEAEEGEAVEREGEVAVTAAGGLSAAASLDSAAPSAPLQFLVPDSTALASMERRIEESYEDYFSMTAILRHVRQLLTDWDNSELECRPKPGLHFDSAQGQQDTTPYEEIWA